ncbi:MAG: TraB/GumN family protein [SAR324 cluster bacterium]|nr:TraB/GumN family protein [SAR324 cluster bacterium]
MEYSANVHTIQHDGKTIFLIGTAHISQSSVNEVNQVIQAENPDVVCVELCASRFEALSQEEQWQNMDIFKVVKEKKTFLLMATLILSSFQKKLGDQIGVKPGAEMLEAAETAKSVGARVELIDRDVRLTLQRIWGNLSFWEKTKLLNQLVMGLFIHEEITEDEIEKLKEVDMMTQAMQQLADHFPQIKQTLIDERDQYMAEKLRQIEGNKIVAVVGAGHVPGMLREMGQEHDFNELESKPPPGKWGRVLKWGIPGVIIGIITYGFLRLDSQVSTEMIFRWFWINGSLSALGTMIAMGHPVTWLTAFVAAPFTSLNPTIAAGWVAGMVELMIRKPQVKDFEFLGEDIQHFKGFWTNRITRTLMVVILANVGSSIGTILGGMAVVSLLK